MQEKSEVFLRFVVSRWLLGVYGGLAAVSR